jgi:bleomycin hydrolase
MTEKDKLLDRNHIEKFQKNFKSGTSNKVLMNAVTRGNIQDITINRDVLNNATFCFSHEIEQSEVTAQKQANTCWLFAGLNWFRTMTKEKFKMKDFEFSVNHLVFWDKIEKANYYLELMIEFLDRDLDDRLMNFLLKNPAPDDGEWHMIANLVKKYGLIPKSAMPNTFNLENSKFLNFILYNKLREYTVIIRKMHKDGKKMEQMRKKKMEFLDDFYRILSIFLGVPPEKFDWAYRDSDKKFHREKNITPVEFAKKYLPLDIDDVYILWNCPSQKTPLNKTYIIEHAAYMTGGNELKALNLPFKKLRNYAVKMLKENCASMFGCDVLQESNTKEGLLCSDLYDYNLVFQKKVHLDKGMRIDYCQSFMNHMMVLSGVDLINNKPVKWKIENSWGNEHGKKGYFIMCDEWFGEHAFELMVPGTYLDKEDKELFKMEPVKLPRWFPMI